MIVRCLQLLSVVIATTLPHSVALAETTSEQKVVNYGYRVISKTRFDRENFTQGLEIHDGRLYVSSGLYGRSMIRVYTFPSLDLIQSVPVDPRIFAEGLTIVNNRLMLLSWRERVMLVYALPELTLIGRSDLPGQGWGATHSGSVLWMSDGSDQLYSADLDGGGELAGVERQERRPAANWRPCPSPWQASLCEISMSSSGSTVKSGLMCGKQTKSPELIPPMVG